jgi:AraC-like DNA-binding protein
MYHPRMLVETAVEQGAPLEALLEGSGVKPPILSSPDARISYLQFGIITANALTVTGNPGLGIDFGRSLRLPHLGMVGVLITNSANARSAIELGIKYARALEPAWDLRLIDLQARTILRARAAIPLDPFLVFATDALLCSLGTLFHDLFGRSMPLIELRLNFPRPDHAERYPEICTAPILFDQEVTEAVFDPAELNAPIRDADPLTARLAERICVSQLPSAVSALGLVGEVRRRLCAASGRYPDPAEIAKELQTSARSLRRGLQETGTSYRALLDEARRAHAIEYVECTNLKIDQIAELVGFSGVRSFHRAFIRWTSQTPASYRDGETDQIADG